MKARVAVIIPYFQRRSGILRRAVASAMAQHGSISVHIVVVDDCSPIPASSELKEVLLEHPNRIQIIRLDKNSGQSVARNTALDRLDPETEYVAFLDSDDQWSQDHLTNAVCALDKGYDFYFSDFYQLHQQSISAFARAKRIDPDKHDIIADCHTALHVYQGDMIDQIITGNIVGTPTVVYRFCNFPAVRFREEFRSAGEDYLFWLELSRLTRRIAFSSAIECKCGEGVNVFSGATWGSEGAIQKLHDELRYLQTIETEFHVTTGQLNHLRFRISQVRNGFIAEIIHRLTHNKDIDRKLSISFIKRDIRALLFFIPIGIRITAGSLKRKLAKRGALLKRTTL